MDVPILDVCGHRGRARHTLHLGEPPSQRGVDGETDKWRRDKGREEGGKARQREKKVFWEEKGPGRRDESERSACPEMTWYVLVSLNLWVPRRSGEEGSTVISFTSKRTELAVSQPAFNSTVISNPLHKSPAIFFCLFLFLFFFYPHLPAPKRQNKKKKGWFTSFFLSFSLIHSFTSAIICVYWKRRDKERGRGKKKQVPGRKKRKNNKRRQRRRSDVWINYILKNLSFASVSAQNLNKCQMPLCVQLFIEGVFSSRNCAGNIKFA